MTTSLPAPHSAHRIPRRGRSAPNERVACIANRPSSEVHHGGGSRRAEREPGSRRYRHLHHSQAAIASMTNPTERPEERESLAKIEERLLVEIEQRLVRAEARDPRNRFV